MKRFRDTDYLVTTCGKIWSEISKKFITIWYDGKGYAHVKLWINGSKCDFRLHRVVAETYIDNPDGLPEVNHKNGKKSNNWHTNLEWCTQLYNIQHEFDTQLANDNSRPVVQYDINMNRVDRYDNAKHAERVTKNDRSSIGKVCKGQRKTCGGYIWKYEEI